MLGIYMVIFLFPSSLLSCRDTKTWCHPPLLGEYLHFRAFRCRPRDGAAWVRRFLQFGQSAGMQVLYRPLGTVCIAHI